MISIAAFALFRPLFSWGTAFSAYEQPPASVPHARAAGLNSPAAAGCNASSSIASNFNGTAISGGNYIWFNSVFKVSGLGSGPTTITFNNSTVQFAASGTNYNLAVPNAKITFDPSATFATTTFDNTTNTWVTIAPPGLAGNTFLAGLTFTVPSGGLPGGVNPVIWNGSFGTDTPGVTVNWQWGAAVYTSFSTSYDALGVKPVDDNNGSTYENSDHASTPENFRSFVVGGARGGGGSNFTGSYSATGSATPCPFTPTPTPTNTPTNTPTKTPQPEPSRTPTRVPPGSADVQIIKTAVAGTSGNSVIFTLKVTNLGPAVANNVVVTDKLPVYVQYPSYTTTKGTCSYDATTRSLTCNLGTLNVNQVVTIKVTTKGVQFIQVFENCALVRSTSFDPNLNNNRSCALVQLGQPVNTTATPSVNPSVPSGSGEVIGPDPRMGGSNGPLDFFAALWRDFTGAFASIASTPAY